MANTIALISDHASPLAAVGGIDSGGQNVYVAQVARHLVRLGYAVDVFTRRDSPSLPETLDWTPGVRVVHVPAGPPEFVRKEDLLPAMGEFADYVCRFAAASGGYRLAHANFFMSGQVALELKRRCAIPFVVTFHALAAFAFNIGVLAFNNNVLGSREALRLMSGRASENPTASPPTSAMRQRSGSTMGRNSRAMRSNSSFAPAKKRRPSATSTSARGSARRADCADAG